MSGGRVSATGRYRRIIRTVRTTSKREAKLALAELETAVAAGRVSFEDQTVAELLHKWMEHIEGLRRANSTLYHYRQYINRDINRRLGKIRLSRLTVLDIDRVYAGMRRRDLAPATIRQVHAILRASLNHAEKWDSSDATWPSSPLHRRNRSASNTLHRSQRLRR